MHRTVTSKKLEQLHSLGRDTWPNLPSESAVVWCHVFATLVQYLLQLHVGIDRTTEQQQHYAQFASHINELDDVLQQQQVSLSSALPDSADEDEDEEEEAAEMKAQRSGSRPPKGNKQDKVKLKKKAARATRSDAQYTVVHRFKGLCCFLLCILLQCVEGDKRAKF